MSGTSSHILCIGAAHWDVIGRAGTPVRLGDDVPGRIERRPGGVALNVAMGLADLGCRVCLCSVVGQDAGGDALLHRAQASGVDCRHVVRISGAASDGYVAIEDGTGGLVAAVADTALLDAHVDAALHRAETGARTAAAIFLEANLPKAAVDGIAAMAHRKNLEVIANPIPRSAEIPGEVLGPIIEAAIHDADTAGITGKAVTPYLLDRVLDLTEGRSLEANIALVLNNAVLAAEIARELRKID